MEVFIWTPWRSDRNSQWQYNMKQPSAGQSVATVRVRGYFGSGTSVLIFEHLQLTPSLIKDSKPRYSENGKLQYSLHKNGTKDLSWIFCWLFSTAVQEFMKTCRQYTVYLMFSHKTRWKVYHLCLEVLLLELIILYLLGFQLSRHVFLLFCSPSFRFEWCRAHWFHWLTLKSICDFIFIFVPYGVKTKNGIESLLMVFVILKSLTQPCGFQSCASCF